MNSKMKSYERMNDRVVMSTDEVRIRCNELKLFVTSYHFTDSRVKEAIANYAIHRNEELFDNLKNDDEK